MKRARITAVAAVSLFAAAVFAGGLSKYKGWDKSPQGDLMTAAERAQWAEVKTDDDADKFVKAFLARRGPDFVTENSRAAAAADKYFTAGKTLGSTIILGPPSGLSMADKAAKGDMRASVDSAMTVGGAGGGSGGLSGGANPGGGGGASVADMMGAATGPGNASGVVHVFTFTYAASQLPAAYGRSFTVNIELDPNGTDHVADRKMQAEVDRLYEMVAETKLTPPAPPSAKQ